MMFRPPSACTGAMLSATVYSWNGLCPLTVTPANTSQGPTKSMGTAPSEIRNATAMAPSAGGRRGCTESADATPPPSSPAANTFPVREAPAPRAADICNRSLRFMLLPPAVVEGTIDPRGVPRPDRSLQPPDRLLHRRAPAPRARSRTCGHAHQAGQPQPAPMALDRGHLERHRTH